MRLTDQKIQKKDKVYYFLPKEQMVLLKRQAEKYPWKFPEITFKNEYVIIPFIDNTFKTKLKTAYFIIKNIILGTCFLDDTPRNVRGVLIDFDDLTVVSRFDYIMKLIEFKYLNRLPIFKEIYTKIYTKGYKILQHDPLVIYKKGEIFVMTKDLEIESGYSTINKNKNIKGKYYSLVQKYKDRMEYIRESEK